MTSVLKLEDRKLGTSLSKVIKDSIQYPSITFCVFFTPKNFVVRLALTILLLTHVHILTIQKCDERVAAADRTEQHPWKALLRL